MKNNLTGRTATAVNAMLAAWAPFENVSIVSLNHRRAIIEAFAIDPQGQRVDTSTIGTESTSSNEAIRVGMVDIGVTDNARAISEFCYSKAVRSLWDGTGDVQLPDEEADDQTPAADLLFHLEKHLEDFLIENWDSTELGQRFDLIELDGDVVSQQYKTEVGTIDILAREKQGVGRYVVIELKKGQTSDVTIGQLSRYMGWIDEKLDSNAPSLGIIIAATYDARLDYAVRRIPGVELHEYRVDFQLARMSRA